VYSLEAIKLIEAIDLFCGIGGLTYGLESAGINVLAGVDNDKTCKNVYEKNNQSIFIFSDITQCDFHNLKSMYSKDSIKVLVGCAPCQPFSSHSFKINKQNNSKDKRWDLIDYFLEAIHIIEPDIISMENVRGIIKTDIFKNFEKQIKKLKYFTNRSIVNCKDYGIPQSRSRLVFLASKYSEIEIPEKTNDKNNYPKVKDFIDNLPELKSGEISQTDILHRAKNLMPINIERIKQSKPKGTWRDWDKNLLPECYKKESGQSYSSVYGRMSFDDIAPTITTQFYNYGSGRFGHPNQDRALSLREGALLQTFPMSYDFCDNITFSNTGRHIGNAVPPMLGKAIGLSIKKHIKDMS